MTTDSDPAKVRMSDEVGLATERACFERWYDAQKDGELTPWEVWQAARADAVSDGHACVWALDNGGRLYRRHKAPQCVSVEAVMDTRTALGVCALQEAEVIYARAIEAAHGIGGLTPEFMLAQADEAPRLDLGA